MKKIALLLSFILLSSSLAIASSYPKYDAELSKIRTVKNSQTAAINGQINEISAKIVELEENTTMSASVKAQKMKEYNAQLDALTNRKLEISQKYKADKEKLKRLYKHR